MLEKSVAGTFGEVGKRAGDESVYGGTFFTFA